MAKYVAKTLGYAEKQIVFKQLSPAMRASALTDGTVDMVVDSFSMDGTHDGEADVAGPYLTVRETLLIRSDSASEITGTDSLSDKTVCAVAGSAADDNIRNRTKNTRTTVAERDTYPQCMTALMIGEADAVAAQQRQTAAVVAAATEKVGGGGSTYQFHIEKMEVRDDQDVERVAQELYYMTEREKRSRGGGSL